LAISGLKDKTAQGSNYLIMMIMGGGFVSVFQGTMASDKYLGIQQSYWVGVVCFAYLALYATVVKQTLKKQGVAIGPMSGGH
jgi:FHS family L-fucose permease-like MFS transporter